MAPNEIKYMCIMILALSLFSLEAGSVPFGARRALLAGVETVFDVTTSGAKADGAFDNTQAFMKAWGEACKSPAPAKLLIPAGNYVCGEIVFLGPCTSPVTVEIQGTLLANSDLSVYTDGVWVEFESVTGVTVTGGGTFDGRGDQVWQFSPKSKGGGGGVDTLLPVSLQFSKVQNSVITNIKVLNSMGFHTKVTGSSGITVSSLEITAPDDSPNTDGLHISSSTDVNVTSLVIATGDDCISIGEGNTNVNIYNVTCGPGHGISVGSLGKRPTEKDVKGVRVTHCTLTGTTNGARIKSYHESIPLVATDIVYEDIIMNDVKNPIIIDQHYNSENKPKPSNVAISNVHFRNIRGTTPTLNAVSLNCSEKVPCDGVELADINFTPSKAPKAPAALKSACANVKLTQTGVQNVDMAGCP